MHAPVNKRRIAVNKARLGSREEKLFNINFWKRVPAGEKLVAAWEMVGEISWFKGQPHGGESRLQRSVERVEHRRR